MRSLLLLVLALLGGCAAPPSGAGTAPPGGGSPYLFVFAGDRDEKDEDFFAVIDVRRDSPTAGRALATLPIGMKASMPHHMEYWMPARGSLLFANAHHHEANLLIDTSDALAPRIARRLQPPSPLRYPHDFARLANGNLLVGYLRSEGASPVAEDKLVPGGQGGLAEYTAGGELIRTASGAVDGLEQPVRVYAIVPMLDIDRIVTTSAPMMEDHSADVVQVWRYSDLKLLHTLAVPPGKRADGSPLPGAARYPFGPRRLADGSVLMNSFGCGFYRLSGIASAKPRLDNVYTIQTPEPPKPGATRGACSIPTIVGKYWIMPVGRAHTIVVLDISDPAAPREVSRLDTAEDFNPHWSAKDPLSDRIIVGAELGGEQGMYMLLFDEAAGRLAFDPSFGSAGGRTGYIDLAGQKWPHGPSGEAWAHAALFLEGAN
ncbi:MAG TPA: hypothetical protein VFQ67_04700 [Allosphingosinicella sp.]|jgi:hypothetical protein|nr:hypothetical protein [Allosphingosinicella sp.]